MTPPDSGAQSIHPNHKEHKMRNWIAGSRFGQWMLNRALSLHLSDPRRFERGPHECNVWGWLYFVGLGRLA